MLGKAASLVCSLLSGQNPGLCAALCKVPWVGVGGVGSKGTALEGGAYNETVRVLWVSSAGNDSLL